MLEELCGISTHVLDVAVRELRSSWVPLAAAAPTFQHGGVLLVLPVGLWVLGDCGLRVW